MCTALTTALAERILCAEKGDVIFQHEVEGAQHLMGYRDYGALLSAPR